jgi:hypothetical protein
MNIEYPFEADINWAREHYLNWNEVAPLVSGADNLWPRAQNDATLLKHGSQTVYTARSQEIFVGSDYETDWREYLTDVYDADGNLVFKADREPYDKMGEAAWGKYLADENAPGIKTYYPETSEARPAGRLELSIGHHGNNLITTNEALKGRGIKAVYIDKTGTQYRVTDRALDRLSQKYSIVQSLYFD